MAKFPGGLCGGYYRPLSKADEKKIAAASFHILEKSGMHVYSETAREHLRKAGAKVESDGKTVKLPKSMVEDAIASAPRKIVLCGREEKHDLLLEDSRVYYGTGGTAINVIDLKTGRRRPSTVEDVKLNARVVDALDNVHLFTINVFPREITNPDQVDVNRFYHSFANTTKHVMGGMYSFQGVKDVVEMAEMIAGGAEKLQKRPFVSFITLIISPFKVDHLYGDIACLMAEKGLPIVMPTEPICGTTSPITLASNVLVHTAETLAGVTLVQAVRKGSPVIAGSVGATPDLATMNVVTGAVERGMLNSATAQMGQYFELPFYSTAGNSDAKTEDAQAAIESAFSNLLVGMSGANYIHDAAGLMDRDLTVSYDKLVMDDEILGMCLRVLKGIEVNDDTLAMDLIEQIGPGGNFIAEEHTVSHMRGEFVDTPLATRLSYEQWEEEGRPEMKTRARKRLEEIMATHKPKGIDPAVDKKIRKKFTDIRA